MAENCKIYTPDTWVSILLDKVGYVADLYGKRILENSCGTGNILRRIVERYILDALKNNYTKEQIRIGLQRDITGLEIDPISCDKCRKRLDYMAKKYGIKKVKWNLIQCDALKYNEKDYAFVIGNPPYITYHDLSVETREFLRANFKVCKKGRFDYCYAFIEKSINNLQYRGRMAYVLPNSILKNVWAEDLRMFIKPYLREIVDLKNRNVFEDVTLSPIILVIKKEKRTPAPKVKYQCEDESLNFKVSDEMFSQKSWAMGSYAATSKLRFGDYFIVANSIATLLNEAFVIKKYAIQNEQYIVTDNILIERSILRPAISIKTLNASPQPLIIFPYGYDENHVLVRYTEEQLRKKYPYAEKYLAKYKDKLEQRTADKTAKWFEYGRSQAISHLDCEKLVMSTIVSKTIKIKYANKDSIPYAGLYIVQKGAFPLCKAKEVLERPDFWSYVKQYGVPTTENSYRISNKTIEDYAFDC